MFQTKNTPENTLILLIFVYLSSEEEIKKKNTANAALTYDAIFLQAASVQKKSMAW